MAVEIDAIQNAKSIGWADALLSRLAANSFGLGGRLSITAPANASALSFAGYSLTGSNASSALDISGTWNTSGTPTLIKANVTNTASNASSLLLDLQVGGTSAFRVNRSGYFDCASSSVGSSGDNAGQFFVGASAGWGDWSYLGLRTKGYLAFATGFGQPYSVFLQADAANTLALRNSTNAQTFNIYNTFTDASNYERGFARWTSNVFELGTQAAGTGTDRVTRIANYAKAGAWTPRVDIMCSADNGSATKSLSIHYGGGAAIGLGVDGTRYGSFASDFFVMGGSVKIGFASNASTGLDAGFGRSAAGVVSVEGASGVGGAMEFIEQTAPSAPSADRVRIYAEDSGGKTRLMARFATGAAQQIAIEP